jgi:hypothetical protein
MKEKKQLSCPLWVMNKGTCLLKRDLVPSYHAQSSHLYFLCLPYLKKKGNSLRAVSSEQVL